MEYLPSYKDSLYLEHHGILGMKWGVRRYQNKDGSLTDAGKKRYRELVTPENNYTEEALRTGFDKQVEKGVENYILGRKIKDPFVRQCINDNKRDIDAMIEAEKARQMSAIHNQMHNQAVQNHQQQINIQQANQAADFARQEAERASRQAASLAISNNTNPFLFG